MWGKNLVRVVDDDISVRRAVAFTLKSAGYQVATFESGVEFLEATVDPQPGCIILDYRMPGMNGLEVQRELKARGLDLPVVVITGHGDLRDAFHAASNGAVDFIEKPFTSEVLLGTVAAALQSADDGLQTDNAAQAKDRLALLTAREREVLCILAEGLSNKGIARKLDISPRTAESHRANIFRKLGANGLSEALALTNIQVATGVRICTRRQNDGN